MSRSRKRKRNKRKAPNQDLKKTNEKIISEIKNSVEKVLEEDSQTITFDNNALTVTSKTAQCIESVDVVQSNSSNDKKTLMHKVRQSIIECLNICCLNTEFSLSVLENKQKIKSGIILINATILKKNKPEKNKKLTFCIDRDIKTSLIHVLVMDTTSFPYKILFVYMDQYPIIKLENYLPNIIMSTQNMLK